MPPLRPMPPKKRRSGSQGKSFADKPKTMTHDRQELWLWGKHPVVAALNNPERRNRLLLLTAEAKAEIASSLDSVAETKRPPEIKIVSRDELAQKLPLGALHQGMALLTNPLSSLAIEDLIDAARDRENACVVVLDQVTDPHNVGAILRSAAAFGALAVVVPDRHAPEESGVLAKSASGALERIPLIRVGNLARALDDLRTGGFWTTGLAACAEKSLADLNLSGKIVLVLGSEGEGLRRLTKEKCDHMAKLPISSEVESLNVSNAAAIALYELVRSGKYLEKP